MLATGMSCRSFKFLDGLIDSHNHVLKEQREGWCSFLGSRHREYWSTFIHCHATLQAFPLPAVQDGSLFACWIGYLPIWSFTIKFISCTYSAATGAVATFRTDVEVSVAGMKIHEELVQEKLDLAKAVASLNTIRCKGKANISIFALVEEDGVEE